MKILGISVLIMGILMIFSIGIDFLQGFNAKTILHNAVSPFKVMESAEWAVLLLFLFILLGETFLPFFQKFKE